MPEPPGIPDPDPMPPMPEPPGIPDPDPSGIPDPPGIPDPDPPDPPDPPPLPPAPASEHFPAILETLPFLTAKLIVKSPSPTFFAPPEHFLSQDPLPPALPRLQVRSKLHVHDFFPTLIFSSSKVSSAISRERPASCPMISGAAITICIRTRGTHSQPSPVV